MAVGEWSNVLYTLYTLYTLNALAGIIASFQNVVLRGLPPDFVALAPGAILVGIALAISYLFSSARSRTSPTASDLRGAVNCSRLIGPEAALLRVSRNR